MRVYRLTLEHFRNYRQATLQLGEGLTILEGRNAAGKTNLLEALWMLGGAKSPRASREDQVVRIGADAGRLSGTFQSSTGDAAGRERELVLFIERGPVTRKRWRLQRVPKKTSEVVGAVSVVLFRPDDLDLLSRSSSYRRTYLDQLLARSGVEHASLIHRVEHVLTQRRAALEALQQGQSTDLTSLDEQLLRDGAELAARRQQLVDQLASVVARVHTTVAADDTTLEIQVENPAVPRAARGSLAIARAYRAALAQLKTQEVAAGRNLVGPQRDDLLVTLGGRALREFGSRGEWRSAVIALKLAELEYLTAKRGERPLLLLDDVLSELDQQRRVALEEWFSKQQTVLATTNRHELSDASLKHATLMCVADGNVHAVEANADATAR